MTGTIAELEITSSELSKTIYIKPEGDNPSSRFHRKKIANIIANLIDTQKDTTQYVGKLLNQKRAVTTYYPNLPPDVWAIKINPENRSILIGKSLGDVYYSPKDRTVREILHVLNNFDDNPTTSSPLESTSNTTRSPSASNADYEGLSPTRQEAIDALLYTLSLSPQGLIFNTHQKHNIEYKFRETVAKAGSCSMTTVNNILRSDRNEILQRAVGIELSFREDTNPYKLVSIAARTHSSTDHSFADEIDIDYSQDHNRRQWVDMDQPYKVLRNEVKEKLNDSDTPTPEENTENDSDIRIRDGVDAVGSDETPTRTPVTIDSDYPAKRSIEKDSYRSLHLSRQLAIDGIVGALAYLPSEYVEKTRNSKPNCMFREGSIPVPYRVINEAKKLSCQPKPLIYGVLFDNWQLIEERGDIDDLEALLNSPYTEEISLPEEFKIPGDHFSRCLNQAPHRNKIVVEDETSVNLGYLNARKPCVQRLEWAG